MQKVTKLPTSESPYVNIDYSLGVIDLRGKSVQENPLNFYSTLTHSLQEIVKSQSFTVTLNFHFEHFNTSSSKCIYEMLRHMKSVHQKGQKNIRVNWHYDFEDFDMRECGEDYQELTGLKFNYISVNNFL